MDIKSASLKELRLGSASFRRRLLQSGIITLDDLLLVSEKEADSRFDPDTADAILNLQEEYDKDPKAFERRYSPLARECKTNRFDSEHARGLSPKPRMRYRASLEPGYTYTPKREIPYLSDDPLFNTLLDYEKKARESLDALDDQYKEVLVYQAFDVFSADIEDVAKLFVSLFERYHSKQSRALDIIHSRFRNIFLIFVADGARRNFDGDNLWGNFFSAVKISSQNVQSEFKTLFVDQLKHRGMPLFAKDDARDCYFYSALLHGGLSEKVWIPLWRKSLLPLAREVIKGRYGGVSNTNGLAVLNRILDSKSPYVPSATVRRLLEKVPKSTLSSLFESAIEIACQMTLDESGFGKKQLISTRGMPEAAMLALKASVGKKRSSTYKATTVDSAFAYLPEANMTLDLAEGSVHIAWPKQHFPKDYLGKRVEYYVNGRLMNTETIEIEVGRCILAAVDLPVEPYVEYRVEVRIVDADGEALDEFEPLRQTFKSEKKGCFEFFMDRNGDSFRLRKRSQRITSTRRVAYLIKEGYGIDPLVGMKENLEHQTSSAWRGTRLVLFDVEPGSSGRIVDLSNDEEVEVWQESYLCHIFKGNMIGHTGEGVDAYGFVPSELATNAGLPVIEIEAIDGSAASDDLEFSCVFNGRNVSVPRRVEQLDDDTASIRIMLHESQMFGYQTGPCVISARQKSTGGTRVFQYKFFVTPIKDFRISEAKLLGSYPMGRYRFELTKKTIIENAQGDRVEIPSRGQYEALIPLADESMDITLHSEEFGEATVSLMTLGVEIGIPERLLKLSGNRPICLADAIELGSQSGNIWMRADGSRSLRTAYVHLGTRPLALFNMEHSGEYTFNVFKDKMAFLPVSNSPIRDIDLTIDFHYGHEESHGEVKSGLADLTVLRCREGFGFSGWRILAKSDRSSFVSLDGKAQCNLHIEIRGKRTGSLLATANLSQGEDEIPIEQKISRKLDAGREYEVVIAPTSWVGDVLEEYAYAAPLTRKTSCDEKR